MISQELPWDDQPPERHRETAREFPKVSVNVPQPPAKPRSYSFDLSSLKKPAQPTDRVIPKVNQPKGKPSLALPSLKPAEVPAKLPATVDGQAAPLGKLSRPVPPFQPSIAPVVSPTIADQAAIPQPPKVSPVPPQPIRSQAVTPQAVPPQSVKPPIAPSPPAKSPPPKVPASPVGGSIVIPPKLNPDQLKPVVRHPNLSLPSFKPIVTKPAIARDRPVTAMNLLREIEATIIGWQQALQQVKDQIQALYAEGPIVDGWLESRSQPGEFSSGGFSRSGRRLKLGRRSVVSQQLVSAMEASPETEYYLCGYDEAGEFWSQPCPPEQVASISLALARHQRLQQLLKQKQKIEAYLGETAETIIEFHTQIRSIGRRGAT